MNPGDLHGVDPPIGAVPFGQRDAADRGRLDGAGRMAVLDYAAVLRGQHPKRAGAISPRKPGGWAMGPGVEPAPENAPRTKTRDMLLSGDGATDGLPDGHPDAQFLGG